MKKTRGTPKKKYTLPNQNIALGKINIFSTQRFTLLQLLDLLLNF